MPSNKAYEMTSGAGSLRHVAPEVAKHLPHNHKVDVYYFFIVLCELLPRKNLFLV